MNIKAKRLLSVLIILAILLVAYYVFNYKMLAPKKPDNIPATAFWVGGRDGGQWYDLVKIVSKNKFRIAIYHDGTGDLEIDTTFALKDQCGIKNIDSSQLIRNINAYDGERILLKFIGNNKYCFLTVE